MSEEKRRPYRTQNRFHDSEDSVSTNKMNTRKSCPSSSHDAKREHYGTRDTFYNNSGRGAKDRKHNTNTYKSGRNSLPNYGKSSAVSNGNEVVYQESHSSEQSFTGLEKTPKCKRISDPGVTVLSNTEIGESRIFFKPDFIEKEEGHMLLEILANEVNWLDKKVIIDGEERRQPRLVAWYGPLPYSYSGVTLEPREFSPTILAIKENVENVLKKENINVVLNSVLLNLYRDGKDSVAWHADDEMSMGIEPTIASVSLGEMRRFELRRKPLKYRSEAPPEFVVYLNHGSLIVMDGVMQLDWQHRVPKEFHDKDKRINLTFRTVYPIEDVRHDARLLCANNYIPPPQPAKSSAVPFELQLDAFPALGNDISPVRQSSVLSDTNKPISELTKVDLDDVMMSKDDVQSTELVNESIRLGAPELMTITDGAHSVISTTEDRVMDDSMTDRISAQISNSTKGAVFKRSKITDISKPQNVTREDSSKTWPNPDKVQEFIPKDRNEKIVTNTNNQLLENQYSPIENENKMRAERIPHHRSNVPTHSPFKNNTKDAKSNQSHAKSVNQVGIENDEFQAYNNDREVIDRLNDVYDYITCNWGALNFTPNQSHELEVHLTVVEHSRSLPLDVLKMLTKRMEHIIYQADRAEERRYQAEQAEYRQSSYYYQRRSNENYRHKQGRGRNDSYY